MMFKNLIRKFHSSQVFWSAETSLLAKLRKKTGYTFSNCKKALEMHQNDLNKAEAWLHKEAQSMGWSKATKLAGRATAQGLVAVKYDASHAALVEINCETDFVAKNEVFRSMVQEAAAACFKYSHSAFQAKGPLTKMCLDSERLGALHTPSGKTLAEQLVLMIGTVGENATLRRAECWKASPGLFLSAMTHPSPIQPSDISTGKFGGLVAYKTDNNDENRSAIGRKICQHIVGMNPSKIGSENDDKPADNSDDETCLIYQECLLDPSVIVKDLLKENNIEVVDFVRFECGEVLDAYSNIVESLETVQTCQ